MLARRWTALDAGCGARWCTTQQVGVAARRKVAACGLRRGTALRGFGTAAWLDRGDGCAGAPLQNWPCASLATAGFRRRGRLIREKIIGHGMQGAAASAAVRRGFFHHRVLALAHQPARQQRRGVLIQPSIQQLGDLFAQIGGVVQTRQLEALQGIAGRREQELPIGLSFVVHGTSDLQRAYDDTDTRTFNSINYVGTVESCATLRVAWDSGQCRKRCKDR